MTDTTSTETLAQTTHRDVKNVYRGERMIGYIGRHPQTWWAHRSYGDPHGPNRHSRGFRSEQAAVDWIAKDVDLRTEQEVGTDA